MVGLALAAYVVLVTVGIFFVFNLSKKVIYDDITSILNKEDSLRTRIRSLQKKSKKNKIKGALIKLQTQLISQGKAPMFAVFCVTGFALAIGGVVLALLIGNYFLTVPLALIFGAFPFLYASSMIQQYDNRITFQLETVLSIITTSYLRTEDIVSAVEENLPYIAPPLDKFFREFVGECKSIRADYRGAIINLKSKIDNEIFEEWCDTLLSCQDDRTIKVTLLPIVSKMTDVRIINEELRTMIASPRVQYFTMVGLALSAFPLVFFLNKDWFIALVFTTGGKITCAVCATAIFITMILLNKFSKPIKYRA